MLVQMRLKRPGRSKGFSIKTPQHTFLTLILLGLAPGRASAAGGIVEASLHGDMRPFRAGLLRLNPLLDQEKTLGISDGVGWATVGETLIGAPDGKSIAAIRVPTGVPVWWNPVLAPPTAQPTIFGSTVVVGLRNGAVQKLDVSTGKKIWEAQLDTFTERPFVMAGTTLLALTSTQLLYALDFQSGKVLWLYDGGFPEGMSVRPGASPIVNENEVIFGITSGELLAINLQAGKLVWRHNPSYKESRFHDVVGQLIVKDQRLLVTRYDGFVASIDISNASKQDFKTIWSDEVSGITTSSFRDGRIYVGCINGDTYAYDSSTGRRIWRNQTGQSAASITPMEANVYVGGTDGRLTAIEPMSGVTLWHDDLEAEIATPPVLVQEMLAFPTSLRNLYLYKVR